MGKQYLVIYLQYDSGCFVQCVRDSVFACRLVRFIFLDAEEHTPELTHEQGGMWLATN